MNPRSYSQALNQLLEPLGFERRGSVWVRVADDFEEHIELQKSGIDGSVTINLDSINLKSRKTMEEAMGTPRLESWIIQRLGHLFGPTDTWWKNDPNGPAEMADKVREFGLPFLERMRDPRELANRLGLERLEDGQWRQCASIGHLAVTLHRMGEHGLACKALDVPRRRHEIPGIVAQIEGLRRYFKCPPTVNWPDP